MNLLSPVFRSSNGATMVTVVTTRMLTRIVLLILLSAHFAVGADGLRPTFASEVAIPDRRTVMQDRAQTGRAVGAAPVFEVVSFKHSGDLRERVVWHSSLQMDPGGKLTGNLPLAPILKFAFGVELLYIVRPEWVNWNCYEIAAIPPAGTKSEAIPRCCKRCSLNGWD